jgi:amino acid transporter
MSLTTSGAEGAVVAAQQTPDASVERFGYHEQLQRSLRTRDLVVYGMVFMVPIAPFGVFGFVWNDSHGMVALAYLIGLVGMLFTALSYATLSRAFPLAGSVYSYAQHGLHEIAGFFAGWLILLDYILVPSLLYLFSAAALQPLLPGVPTWLWLAGFVIFNAAVNFVGIKLTARLNWWMLIFELITLALFVGIGLHALYGGMGAGRLTFLPIYDARAFSLATVVGATSIAVLSFLGFDGISTLSEESNSGRNSVARATVLSLLLVGVLFMVQTWIAADLARGTPFPSADTAFFDLSFRVGGRWLMVLVIIAQAVSSGVANAMAAQAATARILFAMARDGKLPAALAKVHPRFRTPYVSTLLVAAVSLLTGLFFETRLDDLTRVVNFGALSGFLLLHLSVIRHFFIRQRSRQWLRHLLFPALGFLIIAFVLFEMDTTAKILGACWIGIGLLYYGVLVWLLKKPAGLDLRENG